jgi:hypothetical protein
LAPRGTSSYDKRSAFRCRFERGQFLWNKTRCLTGCTGSPSSGRKRLLVDHCSSLANTADGSALRKRAGLLIPRLRIPFLPPKIPTPPTPTPQRATIAALRLTTWREKFHFGDIPKVAFGAINPRTWAPIRDESDMPEHPRSRSRENRDASDELTEHERMIKALQEATARLAKAREALHAQRDASESRKRANPNREW